MEQKNVQKMNFEFHNNKKFITFAEFSINVSFLINLIVARI